MNIDPTSQEREMLLECQRIQDEAFQKTMNDLVALFYRQYLKRQKHQIFALVGSVMAAALLRSVARYDDDGSLLVLKCRLVCVPSLLPGAVFFREYDSGRH